MRKQFIAFIALVLIVVGATGSIQAQVKIGYINSSDLLAQMPERDSLQAVFDKERQGISKRMEELQVEYNNKLDTYVNQRDSLSDFVRKTKETELTDIKNRIDAYNQTAGQELQKRQSELLQPLFNKVQKAIKEVAEENKFTYILDVSTGVALYYPEGDTTLDVMPLVKAKLGIK
ncbi:MAG: OmpH family outer membrane protein [Bacteroidales bacterium]|nr:OmpH family outer membrane protein [Bacteroidales bacterium]